jgi:hypothetical protein
VRFKRAARSRSFGPATNQHVETCLKAEPSLCYVLKLSSAALTQQNAVCFQASCPGRGNDAALAYYHGSSKRDAMPRKWEHTFSDFVVTNTSVAADLATTWRRAEQTGLAAVRWTFMIISRRDSCAKRLSLAKCTQNEDYFKFDILLYAAQAMHGYGPPPHK